MNDPVQPVLQHEVLRIFLCQVLKNKTQIGIDTWPAKKGIRKIFPGE